MLFNTKARRVISRFPDNSPPEPVTVKSALASITFFGGIIGLFSSMTPPNPAKPEKIKPAESEIRTEVEFVTIETNEQQQNDIGYWSTKENDRKAARKESGTEITF